MEIRLPVLRTRATVEPSTLNREERTVEITWTTGSRVLRGFWDRYWEELSLDPKHVRMARLNNSAPFLIDHRRSVEDTAGVVVPGSARLGAPPRAKVRFLKAGVDPAADRAFEKMADGIVTDVSVGYMIHKMEKVEDGADKIPVMRAVDWEPYEISLVPIGADPGAGVRSEGAETYPCEIITRGAKPQEEQNVADKINTAPAEGTRAEAPTVDLDAVRAEAAKAERERVAQIGAIVRKAGLGVELSEQLVRDGKTIDETRAAVLDELAKRSEAAGGPGPGPSGAVEVGATEHDKQRACEVAWLIERAGQTRTVERAAQNKHVGHLLRGELDAGPARGLTLLDMARDFLERQGVRTRGMGKLEIAGRALSFRAGAYQPGATFPVLFETAIYKMMLAEYAIVDDTWRMMCGTDTVPDFRESNRYRNGSFGPLDDIGENGEFKEKAIPDGARYKISTGTKGNTISLTRQALVDDDMGALSDVAQRFGRSAGLTIETNFYALLAENAGLGPVMDDGKTLFHADHGNIGTASALSVAGIDADRVKMAEQKDVSANEYIVIRPRVLLVPIGLGGEARVINDAQYDVDAVAANATNKFLKPNKVRGLFQEIVDTPRVTGTRRYLFADPNEVPAIKVVFLEGSGEVPQMEMENGFEIDGVRWRVRMDVKVQAFDYKGAVTNAGA